MIFVATGCVQTNQVEMKLWELNRTDLVDSETLHLSLLRLRPASRYSNVFHKERRAIKV